MKNIFFAFLLVFSSHSYSFDGELVIHGNFEDDKYCSQQVRELECGDTESQNFNQCVAGRLSELVPKCQDYHLDEMSRESDREDSKLQ